MFLLKSLWRETKCTLCSVRSIGRGQHGALFGVLIIFPRAGSRWLLLYDEESQNFETEGSLEVTPFLFHTPSLTSETEQGSRASLGGLALGLQSRGRRLPTSELLTLLLPSGPEETETSQARRAPPSIGAAGLEFLPIFPL